MNVNHLKLVVAAGVCVAGLAALIFALRGGPSKPRSHGGLTVAANIEFAQGAALVRPATTAEVSGIIERFREGVRAACSRLAGDQTLDPASVEGLVRISVERLRLVLEPDYDAYLDHLRALTGREIGADGAGAFVADREAWSGYAKPFHHAPIDPGAVQVAAYRVRGRKIEGFIGGHTTGMTDSKTYYSDVPDTDRDLEKAEADLFEVRVAAETRDAMEDAPVRSFIVFRFIRTPRRPAWMPRHMGINDPLGGDIFLHPGWL